MSSKFSIVIPARNEAGSVGRLVSAVRRLRPDDELIVVDDGSSDSSGQLAREAGARVIVHPYNKGNGAAIKRGALAASGDYIVFLDADGQHDPADITNLVAKLEQGYDMVVGARSGLASQASIARWTANNVYNRLASWMVGQRIDDLTSGFRVVSRKKFLGFLYLLPNGFSYPTTSTMAFFRAGYSVGFVPIEVRPRVGRSHISLVRDGVRFLLIIFKIGTLYSPLKIYFPISIAVAGLGFANYLFAALVEGSWRFTNMTALLVSSGIIIFLLGLLSEQLTSLQYKDMAIDEDE